MQTHSIDKLNAHLTNNALTVVMIIHDDFDHHETYVLCSDENMKFRAILYVAPDDCLTDMSFDSAAEALAYLMQTAFSTFAFSVSPQECTFDASRLLAKALI